MIAAVLLALPTALALTDPLAGDLCYALAALLALYLAYGMLVEGVHRGWGLWRARRRLGRAGGPGELREVATRLRGMDVGQGRARLCRDVAVRCLEGDARFGGLEGRLRREAKRWKWIMM